MPNADAQNRNTSAALAAIAGASWGSVTVRNARHGEAPRVRAASVWRGSSAFHSAPTWRTTTDTLKKTMASTTAVVVWSSPVKPSGPPGASRARNATPTTTVGSTNGTSTRARSTARPGTRRRCSTNAVGRPSATETTVPAAAIPSVWPRMRHVRSRARVSPKAVRSTAPVNASASPPIPRQSMAATGHAKKTSRKATGRTAATSHHGPSPSPRPRARRRGRSVPGAATSVSADISAGRPRTGRSTPSAGPRGARRCGRGPG